MTVAPDEEDPDPPSEEARLFRDAVRGVKPLGSRSSAPVRPRARPRARFTRADRAAVLRESLDARDNDPELAAGDELVYYRPEIQPMVVRRLRRGEYRVQREIDLHGLTVAEAKQALRQFLIQALESRVRCVCECTMPHCASPRGCVIAAPAPWSSWSTCRATNSISSK